MIEGQPQLVEHLMFIDRSAVLRSDETGIFYPLVEKGHTVVKGALIGYVTNFFGQRSYELRAFRRRSALHPQHAASEQCEPLAMIGHVAESER